MESRGPEDSKNVKTSQAYFFEGFISFFEDCSLTISSYDYFSKFNQCNDGVCIEYIYSLKLFL